MEITVYGPPPPSSPLPPLDAIESPLIAADAASAGGEKEGEEEGKPVVIKPLRECLLAWDKGGEEEEEEEAPAGAGSEDGDGNVSPSSQQQPRGKSLAPLLFPPPPLPSSSSSPSGLTVLVPVGEEAEAAATAGGGAGWVHATVRIFLSVTPPVASMNGTKSSSGRKSKRKKDKGAGAKKESKSSSSSVDEKQPPLYSLGKDGGLCADVLVEPWGPGGSARAVVIPSSASGGGEEEKDASVSSLSSSSPAAGASHQKRRLSPSSPSSSLTAGSELAPIRLGGEEEEAWWWEWADAETRPDFRYWRQLLLSSLHVEGGEAGEEQQQRLRRRLRRRLLDSYGQSLIHVNRLYHQVGSEGEEGRKLRMHAYTCTHPHHTPALSLSHTHTLSDTQTYTSTPPPHMQQAFGREQRRAPAHMPHMIDRALVQEMQDRWREGRCMYVYECL